MLQASQDRYLLFDHSYILPRAVEEVVFDDLECEEGFRVGKGAAEVYFGGVAIAKWPQHLVFIVENWTGGCLFLPILSGGHLMLF